MCHKVALVEREKFEAVGQVLTKQPPSSERNKANPCSFYLRIILASEKLRIFLLNLCKRVDNLFEFC